VLVAGVGGAVLYLVVSRLRRQEALDEARGGASGPSSER